MFERTLQDLIRGLRAHKASSKAQEDAFLAEAIKELRDELKGKDMALKAEGVLKMCYLMMLYPIPPPPGFAFHVVEVMSSPRYHLKQLGYLAAPMAFSGDTEEVVLTVNGINKDVLSPHLALPPLPLTALPHLLSLSSSLSHTLHPDLLHLLTHSSPRIRKRAVLCLLPCWEAFPEGLREGFPRLRDRLLDDDQGVVGATVGVVMELARRQGGKNYLPLAPELFGILTGSSNNWMLIKVVKLFAILTPLEPRLVRKLLPPLTALISSTSAISLLYECVRTCIVGGMLDPDREEGEALARVCVEKLGGYLRDEGGDQNLRYIALLAMVKIIPTHPHMVAEYQEEIMHSLDDPDVSIRMRALELVTSMVDQENLQPIVDQLLSHLSPPETPPPALPSAISSLVAISTNAPAVDPTPANQISLSPAYRLLLTQRLLAIISQDTYANITDFEWVISVLIDVGYVSHVDVAKDVKEMVLDVVGRVRDVRGFAVRLLEKVLSDEDFRERGRERTGEDGLLEAAIWVCGEYSGDLPSPLSVISSILSPTLHLSSPTMISLSLQAAAKIVGNHLAKISSTWSGDLHEQSKNLVKSVIEGIQPFLLHHDLEAQERAAELSQLLQFVQADLTAHVPPPKKPSTIKQASIPGLEGGFEMEDDKPENQQHNPPYPKSLFLLEPLFTAHKLNTLAYKAQEAVKIPEGLDFEHDIVAGAGFSGLVDPAIEVDDDLEVEESETEGIDLGVGGGKGMEELRRVLREQEERSKLKGKGKGKKKKKEGQIGKVSNVEEKEEKERRKAARRAMIKDDPYYLYDNKNATEDVRDVDDIPIVRLDDSELGPTEESTTKSTKPKLPKKTPTAPPIFNRSGEMPEGASPAPNPATNGKKSAKPAVGLAAVDLLDTPVSSRTSMSTRFEEYKIDDGEEIVQAGDEVSTPVAGGDIEVVRVKRKKRDGGTKKKRSGAQ